MKKLLKSIGAAIWYFFIYLIMQVGITLIFVLVYALRLGFGAGLSGQIPGLSDIEQFTTGFLSENTNFMLLISGLMTILTLILVFSARKKSFLTETGFSKVRLSSLWPLIPAGLVLNIFVSSIIGMLPIPEDVLNSYEEAAKLVTGGSLLIQVLNVAVVTPIVEEIIFRGLIFTRLKKGMPQIIAAFLSAAVFGVMHGHIIWAAYGFIIGLVLIGVYLKYRSLTASILLHMSFNATSFLLERLNPEGEIISMVLFILSAALVAALAVSIIMIKPLPKGQEREDEPTI